MSGGNFDLLKVSKMTINFELLKVSKMTSVKIYVSSVMEKDQIWTAGKPYSKGSIGTLPQEEVMLLPYNHVTLTNLYIFCHREAAGTPLIHANA